MNHVNVRPGQVLFTAFPFRDVKPVTEGMYRWDAERNETETLITPDKYSIDYVGYLGRKALCLGPVSYTHLHQGRGKPAASRLLL